MFNRLFIIATSHHLYNELIERVVIAATYTHGIPATSTLHAGSDTRELRVTPELLFLVLIFHAQEKLLLLQ